VQSIRNSSLNMNQSNVLRWLAPAALAASFFESSASAQSILYTRFGDKANDRLGQSVRSAGDVDNDGKPDFIVGAPEDGNIFGAGEGFARVYSGATGNTLYTFNGALNDDGFGTAVDGAGDVNQDGFADLIIGAPNAQSLAGTVYVKSGATGLTLYTINGAAGEKLGSTVAGVGDINNDGFADFLCASPTAAGGGTARGTARIYSGQSGLLIGTINGTANNERLGVSADAVGDINGDGFKDFIIGSYFGGAKIYSGQNLSVLRTFPAASADDRFGFSVAGAGDVNGDSIADVIIGAPQDGNIFSPGNGYAKIYSGANGSLIRTLTGSSSGDRFGCSVGGARDMDADGRAEVVVGADQQSIGGNGYARLFSGLDGSVIHTFSGTNAGSLYGTTVDGLGDVNANGNFEVIVGAPSLSTGLQLVGRVDVWSANITGCPAPYTFCAVNNNSTGQPALISYTGTTSIAANNFGLSVAQCPPNCVGLFYYGTTEVQQVFGNGWRCVSGNVFRLPAKSANASGVATHAINYGSLPIGGQPTVGSTWKFQFWYRNAAAGGANFNLSNGLSVTFCN
jgi:hypothetical protein